MSQPLTPDALVYDLTPASDPQVSPDGRRIVFALTTTDRQTQQVTSHLWLCDVDGGNRRQLTYHGGRNGEARWSPDGRAIAFVSDRVKPSGLFVLPLAEGGEAREVTRHGQEIKDLAWSPDGRRLAYITQVDPENSDEAERPPEAPPPVRVTRRIDYKQDGRGYLGDARRQVFVVDVERGERRQVTTTAVDHEYPQWSPDGQRLAVKVPNRNGMCSQLGLVDVATGETCLVGPELGVVTQ